MVKDCNTCKHHVQGRSIDDVPMFCWNCVSQPGHLPCYEPMEDENMAKMKQLLDDPEVSIPKPPPEWSLEPMLNAPWPGRDNVTSPSHYSVFPDMEALDLIYAGLTREEYRGYLKGNILKYRLRAGKKGEAMEDLAKADQYREWLGDHMAGDDSEDHY